MNPFTILSQVSIIKEVLLTQTITVRYFSNIQSGQFGHGLASDTSYEISQIDPQNSATTIENYNDLTGSSEFDLTLINSLQSGSNFDYPKNKDEEKPNIFVDFIKGTVKDYAAAIGFTPTLKFNDAN